jgi:basic membrane lipoprotein Med (substrate-binding protein (PBP1-ABC) superfamily)
MSRKSSNTNHFAKKDSGRDKGWDNSTSNAELHVSTQNALTEGKLKPAKNQSQKKEPEKQNRSKSRARLIFGHNVNLNRKLDHTPERLKRKLRN